MKHFNCSVQYYLVQHLNLSNKEAHKLIQNQQVKINNEIASYNTNVLNTDILTLDDKVIKESMPYYYIAFHKAVGIETTLNPDIEDNLLTVFSFHEKLFPVGRLDKASEGLLLLTNDGILYKNIVDKDNHQPKKYIVSVDKPLTEDALQRMRDGIEIIGKITRPAIVELIDEKVFSIILTEGLNRQIRRMCHKLNYEVQTLKRISIVNIQLGDLKPNTWRHLTTEEIYELHRILSKVQQ